MTEKTLSDPTRSLEKSSVWRLIDEGKREPAYNMALEEVLLADGARRGGETATLRFYGWQRPAITIGYTQDLDHTIHQPLCRAHGIRILRRLTGGGAVFHDDELTYAVIAPWNTPAFPFRSTKRAFRQIARALERGLRSAGLPVCSDAPSSTQRLREPCFASIAPAELTIDGKKIIGSAQRRMRAGFIQHGSIPFTLDRPFAARVFGFSGSDNLFHNMITLSEVSPSLTLDALKQGLKSGFVETFNAQLRHRPITQSERKKAEMLAQKKYQSTAWRARGARPTMNHVLASSYPDPL